MSAAYCRTGRYRMALVTTARGDLAKVARLATRDGLAGERAQRFIPERRADLDRARETLATHLTECDECQPCEQVSA